MDGFVKGPKALYEFPTNQVLTHNNVRDIRLVALVVNVESVFAELMSTAHSISALVHSR